MLNIKNRNTEDAVRKLAELLDTSLTEAITIAVRRELRRLETDRDEYLQQLQQAATQVREISAPSGWLAETDLYDRMGLPQ